VGFIPLSEGLELESEFILIVVLCQCPKSLLVVEDVLDTHNVPSLKRLRRWMTSKGDVFNFGWLGSGVEGKNDEKSVRKVLTNTSNDMQGTGVEAANTFVTGS
jgi:hypothetical protein